MKELNKPHRSCPACGGRTGRQYGIKNRFLVLGCRSCDTLFTDRLPVEGEEEDYDCYYSESNLQVPEFIEKRLNEIVGLFANYRETGRLLDIGFGAGTLLDVAQDLGWEASGVEVSLPAVEQARSKNLDVRHGGLRDASYPDNWFDVVTASEILEHLPEPVEDLREIVRILRPGGLFWATTPSARAISFRLMNLNWSVISPPEHIQLYSLTGARSMLKEAGFKNIRFKTYGVNPSEIRNFFFGKSEKEDGFSRVETAYELNESLMSSPGRRFLKNMVNETLNLFRLGDSLKIFAEKAQ
jgi:SAM-dependent methyltransferase